MKQISRKALSKFTALVASLCLALALVPAMAFATPATTGSINFLSSTDTTLTVASGQTATVGSLLGDPTVNGDEWHYDYVVTSGTDITVNKHTGVVTASSVTADSTATVTVYLMSENAPAGNNGKPCTGYTILDQKTVTIAVDVPDDSEEIAYGYQGNNLQIVLDEINGEEITADDVDVSGNSTDGWVNDLGTLTRTNGNITFEYSMNYGTGSNTISDYSSLVAGKISLYDSSDFSDSGSLVCTFGDENNLMSFSNSGTRLSTLDLVLAASDLSSNQDYYLVFSSNYCAGNTNNPPLKTLEVPVAFKFGV